ARAERDAIRRVSGDRAIDASRADEGERPSRDVRRLVAPALDAARLEADGQSVARPQRTRPLRAPSYGFRGHTLPPGEALARAVAGDGSEGLVVGLGGVEAAGLESPLRDGQVGARRHLLLVRVVRLERRAVRAALAEEATADEERGSGPQPTLHHDPSREVLRARLRVHGPA